MKRVFSFSLLILGLAFASCSDSKNDVVPNYKDKSSAEAKSLLQVSSSEGGRIMYEPGKGVQFRVQDSVFVKSALAINLTKDNANVTLPLFKGIDPKGKDVFYIITDASDFNVAKQMGVNYAPKLVNAINSGGEQYVTLVNGHIKFKGAVNFAPNHAIIGGDAPNYFPPKSFQPGAVADAEWSSIVVLPSGQVLNAQIVSNETGDHDRMVSIDKDKMSVTLSILDGFRGGKQYFFHLVTDATADLPATLEKGVSAPRLAKIPGFGKSRPEDKSAFLGFSPNANGITDLSSAQGQGFAYSIRNAGIDPINVFPLAPRNDVSATTNNYSPLWDAHVSKWTDKAFQENKVRRITSIEDQKMLIEQGYLTSLAEEGEINTFTGLRPVNLMINCPVIAHPSTVQ